MGLDHYEYHHYGPCPCGQGHVHQRSFGYIGDYPSQIDRNVQVLIVCPVCEPLWLAYNSGPEEVTLRENKSWEAYLAADQEARACLDRCMQLRAALGEQLATQLWPTVQPPKTKTDECQIILRLFGVLPNIRDYRRDRKEKTFRDMFFVHSRSISGMRLQEQIQAAGRVEEAAALSRARDAAYVQAGALRRAVVQKTIRVISKERLANQGTI